MKEKISHVFYPGRSLGNFPAMLQAMVEQTKVPLKVTVEAFKPPKSSAQRDYFHAVVLRTIAIALEAPYWKVKEVMRQVFLQPEPVEIGGEVKYVYPSTESLTREQYSDLIECCLAWAANRGIYIPGPDEELAA